MSPYLSRYIDKSGKKDTHTHTYTNTINTDMYKCMGRQMDGQIDIGR